MNVMITGLKMPKRCPINALIYPEGRAIITLHSGKTMECRAEEAADVRPVVRGKWEEVEVTWLSDIEDQPDAIATMFCPKCKRFANHVYHYGDPTHGMNYCPNCGADMREER